tara:strand:+ start:314 stop:568 length:255 start_codon:yes stop_codon:yes gene_type:complete
MKKNKKEQLPSIYVSEAKDNSDGSCTVTFDTNKAFDELYKKEKGRKRVSNKGLGNYVLELIRKGLAKEDGYDLKTLTNFPNDLC